MTPAERAEFETLARRWNPEAYISERPTTLVNTVGIKMTVPALGVYLRSAGKAVVMFEVRSPVEALSVGLLRDGIQRLLEGSG